MLNSIYSKQLANEDSALAAQAIVRDVEAYCLDLTGTDTTLINFASSDLKLAVVSFYKVDRSTFISANLSTSPFTDAVNQGLSLGRFY